MKVLSFSSINLADALIYLLCFTLPLHHLFSSYIVGALLLFSLYQLIKNKKLVSSYSYSTIALTAYFLWTASGVFYTSDISTLGTDLRIKLPFILFPFIVASYPSINLKKISLAFIAGNVVALLWCLSQAIAYWFFQKDASHFFYTGLSVFMHPGYFSMYLLLAIIFCFEHIRQTKNFFTIWLFFNVIVFFIIGVFLLSSRTAILALPIVIGIYLLYAFIKTKKNRAVLAIFFVTLSIGSLFLLNSKNIHNRLSLKNLTNITGNVRPKIWKSSIKVIQNHIWTGVSSGDVKKELIKQFEKDRLTKGMERKYNTHNQYLQILLSGGIIALFLWLIHWFYFIKEQWKKQYFPAFLFLIIVMIFMTTESIMERQAGAMFYGFFLSVFSHPAGKSTPFTSSTSSD